MRIPALAAAAVLALGVAACTNEATTPAQTPAPATTGPTSPTMSPAVTPTATTTGTASPAPATGDQSTPEAAAESALRALSTGDAGAACQYVSDGAAPVAGNPQDEATCEQVLQGFIAGVPQDQLRNLENATVEGATVNGTTATFENARANPPMPQLAQLRAAEIDGDWFLVLF